MAGENAIIEVMNKQTIFIVEDDKVLRGAYQRRFARTSFNVRTAENGQEALQMMQQEQPDLLICDLMMPVQDGWWVLEQVRERGYQFPILVLTNLDDDATIKRLDSFKVDGYLVKRNMSLHSLVEKVNELLEAA